MTKEKEADHDLQKKFEDLIQEALKNAGIDQAEIENASKQKNKIKIEPVENYLITMGYKDAPKKIRKEFPALFKVKLDKKDDMLSETPGVERHTSELFYYDILGFCKELEYKEYVKSIKKKKNKKNNTNK